MVLASRPRPQRRLRWPWSPGGSAAPTEAADQGGSAADPGLPADAAPPPPPAVLPPPIAPRAVLPVALRPASVPADVRPPEPGPGGADPGLAGAAEAAALPAPAGARRGGAGPPGGGPARRPPRRGPPPAVTRRSLEPERQPVPGRRRSGRFRLRSRRRSPGRLPKHREIRRVRRWWSGRRDRP